MPDTVTAAFDEYDDELKLNSVERQAAVDCHHEIRDCLADAGIAASAILQGSLARKTMLTPLRDIDMVVFLTEDLRYLLQTATGPDAAMDILEGALRRLYPNATYSRSRHALKIDFGDGGFSFDIVPGFDREHSKLIDIANRDAGTWDASDTRLVIEAVQARNQVCNGQFVHHVRMLKDWGRKAAEETPGFVLECVAYAILTEASEHPAALERMFDEGQSLIDGGSVLVPGSDENVLDRLSAHEQDTLLSAFAKATKQSAEAAGLAAAGDDQAAIEVWHELLGDPFPQAKAQSAAAALQAMAIGGITSTGRATHTGAARTPTPPTRSWRSG